MHASTLHSVLEHLRKLSDPARVRELSDADLLERFRLCREEAAFTLLVQRHGPMVLAVCRRVLGDAHSAEDAFQATFLVLVREAAAIRKRQSLASWLHGVAWRIAYKARRQSARRRAGEREAVPPARNDDSFETLTARELRAALDEEIARLPAKYRSPLVLCYLADKTHEQAAQELGWPKSSVTARLAKARTLLRRRLQRRGYSDSVGLLAALLIEQSASATVPSLLTLATVRLAVQAANGETLAATTTAALADTFVKGTAFNKWTAILILLSTMGMAAVVGPRMVAVDPSSKGEESAAKTPAAGNERSLKAKPPKSRADLLGDPLPDEVAARIGSSRLRHPGYVRTLAFSSDGKLLISGGGNTIRIWNAATGKLRRRFDVTDTWALSFALHGAKLFVADAALEKGIVTLRAVDSTTGKMYRQLSLPERATTANLTLSPNGKWLAYTHDQNMLLYDTSSGRELHRMPEARDMSFSADGKTLVLCDVTDTIGVYDTISGNCKHRLQHKGDRVADVAVSADGRLAASIPWNDKQAPGEMSVWDLRMGKEIHRLKGAGGDVLCAAFSADGKYVAVGCQHHHLLLFDLTSGKEVRRYPTDAYFAHLAFSPDGTMLAAASGEGAIRLWETATGRVLPGSVDPSIDAIHELRFGGEGRRLIGFAAMPIAWESATGREIRRFFKVADHHRIALSPDESLLADADFKLSEATIRLRDATSGKEVSALKGHEKGIWRVLFSPDGRRLASCSYDGTIRVWNVVSGRQEHKLLGGGERTMRLVFSPDGCWLASASDSRGPRGRYEVILWDLKTGQEKTRFFMAQDNSAHQLAFSPNSRLLAAVGGEGRSNDPGEVQVWDVSRMEKRFSLDGHKSRVGSVAFSPDGRTLATGDMSGKLLLWELASGRLRHHFAGHESWITSLAFSPNNRLLAASSFEAPVYVWDMLGILETKQGHLSNGEVQHAWTALARDDAFAAFQAIRRLAAAPERGLPFLREHLKPVPAPERKHVRQLVDMLDSAAFSTRQKAAEELEKLADAASSQLRHIVANEKPSLEMRRRLQQILESIESKPESLRAVRAVEVLEWIATPDAVRLIDKLANGAPDARLTREVVAARSRLRK